MPENDAGIYARIIRLVTRLIVVLGGLGTVAAGTARGWRFGLGFLVGAAVSYLSFWRWRKLVESLGGGTPQKRSTVWMVIRFAILVAIAYAIVKYLEVTPLAVLLGLLVSAAAVIVAMVFELIYAGT